jgi:hypothetical protein
MCRRPCDWSRPQGATATPLAASSLLQTWKLAPLLFWFPVRRSSYLFLLRKHEGTKNVVWNERRRLRRIKCDVVWAGRNLPTQGILSRIERALTTGELDKQVKGTQGCPVNQWFFPLVSMTSQKTHRNTLIVQHRTQSEYYTITALLNESQVLFTSAADTTLSFVPIHLKKCRMPTVHYQHIACYVQQHRTQSATSLVLVTRPTYMLYTT